MSAHFLCPKPAPEDRTPFIPAVPEMDLPWVLAPLVPAERKALEAIVECADILTIDGEVHLILPARPELIDALAAYGAEGEDREPALEDEKDEGEVPLGSLGDGYMLRPLLRIVGGWMRIVLPLSAIGRCHLGNPNS